MTFDTFIVLAVLAFMIVSLYTNLVGPAFTFIIGVLVLGLFRILTPSEILAGFGNEQIMVIIMLLLIGEVIRTSGVLEGGFDRLFSRAKTRTGFLSRMLIIISGLSTILNNTPLVAIMMPYVNSWSRKNNISPSKFLIPLSYAAMLGGCATLIGTSTNLIVLGFVESQTVIPSFKTLNFFDFTYAGLPMVVVGIIYLIVASGKLLPDNQDLIRTFRRNTREYLVHTIIPSGSDLPGKTVHAARLRNLKGLFLVEIIRQNAGITPVHPNEILQQDDILVFAGDTHMIADLVNSGSGLLLAEMGMYSRKNRFEALEVVVSYNSSFISRTVKETKFRSRFDAAVIAIHRGGERVGGRIGDVRIQPGDVLLVLAGDDFHQHSRDTQDFYLISRVRDFKRMRKAETILLVGGLLAAIAFSAVKLISLFMALSILLVLILLFRLASPKELPRSIDFNLAIIIAMSIALGTAMIKTGFATHVSELLVRFFMPFGVLGLFVGIYIITAILSAYITNKAAVAIIFPIVISIAAQMNLNPLPLVLNMTYAAAASFITPVGYQTNLMVYGPGGYTFKDFMVIGVPLSLLYMVVSISILYLIYFV